MVLLQGNGYELEIEKGVYVYHRKFGNRTRDDPAIFIEWKDLDNPKAIIQLTNNLATILERFPGMVLEVKMKDTQTIMEGHKMIADTNDYTMVNGPASSGLEEQETNEHVQEYAKLVYGLKNYGHEHFMTICEHFKYYEYIEDHYKELRPIIILANTMLCEECYKKILMGNAREVFESCREIDENEVESNILDLVMLKVDNLQRTRYRNEEKQINRELVDYEPECECKCRNILLIS